MKNKLIGYGLAITSLALFFYLPDNSWINILTSVICLIISFYFFYTKELLLFIILFAIGSFLNAWIDWHPWEWWK